MNARRLTEDQVADVIRLSREGKKGVELARMFGVSPQLISFVRRRGYKPTYRKVEEKILSEFQGWRDLADRYNAMNPDDQISTDIAIRAHESALQKFRAYFAKRGIQLKDLV